VVQLDKLPEGVPVLKLTAKSANPGQMVHSVGNPGASDARWIYTSGTVRQVSHKRWRAKVERTILTFDADVVETQSPTNPGDSGGPLVNDALELVAVTQGASTQARELSLFIDIGEVKKLLQACDVPLTDMVAAASSEAADGGGVETADVFALIKCLQDKDAKIRVEAARRLAELGPEARPAARALKKALKDDEPWVRKNAVLALGKLGKDGRDLVRKAVFDVLRDTDADVRLAALQALANLGAPASEELPTLLSLLHESRRRQELKACLPLMRSLATLGAEAKDAVGDLRALLKSEDREVRVQTLATLRKIGPAALEAATDMVEYLKDPDKSLRLQAAFTLAALDPKLIGEGKDGVAVLVLALRPESLAQANDAPAQARVKEISLLLVKLGQPAADRLLRAIEGDFRGGRSRTEAAALNAAARETALKIIAEMGSDAHSAKLIAALAELQRADPSRAVRDAARSAYIKIQASGK
jgi:HEAT repeat protein